MPEKIGPLGENIAAEFLARRGFRIVQRNWRCHQVGEIDLIVTKKNELVFVEVKTRTNQHFGAGIDSVDEYKLVRLFATAEEYVLQHQKYARHDWQLDVIEVHLNFTTRRAQVQWWRGMA